DRVHVVAPTDVHLLAAAHEPEAAPVVDPAEVAGAHEPVVGERGAGRLGVLPVAAHHGGGAEAHCADSTGGYVGVVLVDQAQLDRGVRTADAHDRVLFGVVVRRAEPDAGFGARVPGREGGAEAPTRLL